jgi:hypothetical protein
VRRILLTIGAVLAFVSCESTGPEGDGSMSILLTDDPGDVSQAVVKIDRIEIVGGSGGPTVMTDGPWIGDLTDLENDFATLVDGFVLPQGTYAQLRVVISEACIGVDTGGADDDVYTSAGASEVECEGAPAGVLQMPSLPQTGIKVILQGPIELGSEQKIVLVDFDVSESFGRRAGGSSQWVMDPTIHGIDITFSGTVNLTVELASGVTLPDPPTFEDFTASLDGEDLPLESDGTASFLYVFPDDYQVDLTPPAGWIITTTETLPIDVTVASGEVEDVTITVESLTQ